MEPGLDFNNKLLKDYFLYSIKYTCISTSSMQNFEECLSVRVLAGSNGQCDYCASKFGAVGLEEALRAEVHAQGKTGIHTTVVCPCYIDTGMFQGAKVK